MTVEAQSGPPEHWQFKIDIWSQKGQGEYQMRLDGFGFLRLFEADTMQELYVALAELDSREVLEAHQNMIEVFEKAPPKLLRYF